MVTTKRHLCYSWVAQDHGRSQMPTPKQREDTITLRLGLPELRVLDQWEHGDVMYVAVEKSDPVIGWCDTCGRRVLESQSTQSRYRTPQDLPLYGSPVILNVRVRRDRCNDCSRWISDSFESVKPFAHKTRRLQEALKEQARGGRTVKEVAESFRVGYHAAYDATFKHAGRGRKRALPPLLGIDEFAKRKGHNYDTILLDLQKHRTVDVIEGRTKDQVSSYLNARSEADRNKVQAVCIDMSDSFLGAIQQALPHAEVVVDRFHVMQLAVKVMDKVRRQAQRGLPKGEKAPLFKARYLLTKPPDDLSDEQLQQREEIRSAHPAIDEAATIVEDLRDWYNKSYKYLGAASNSLNLIINDAATSENNHLQTLAKTLTNWNEHIVAYMRWYITNGPTEGTNNKVKTIKRAAYGHRNRINLKTRILAQSR